jgi:hypothetical protein
MRILSESLASPTYAEFAAEYEAYYLENLTDKKDFIWWGWHRHYDVHKDVKDGHDGNHHEIHALHDINWEYLWGSNALAVEKEINAIWKWHVIDKQTGETNRHGDGRQGCDFSISGGAIIEAFIFMYAKSKEPSWLKKAELIADYYWEARNTETNLFPERPNAGSERFDGSSFVTSITGLYCHSLLKAYEKTGIEKFRTQAITYLSAYNKYGYDKNSGKYWGALNLDGTHIPGPRIFTDNIDSSEGYLANQPRGHLDLWEPYILGYQYPIYTAQVYAYAYELTGEPEMLEAANRFAVWISNTPVGTVETKTTWYSSYTNNEGLQGTYAGKYGRTVSFYLQMFILTGDYKNLIQAKKIADLAINKLYYKGLFRGHPAKQYYEAVDGVGYLLYALVQLNEISKNPEKSLQNKGILFGDKQKRMPMDNW